MSKESKTMEREAQVKARAKEPWTARRVGDLILNNALIIIMVIAVIYIAIVNKNFMKPASIINILAQTCAYLPVALGVGGCIVLTGTDLSAGRIVGLTACISASLLQSVDAASKMWVNLTPPNVILVLILAMVIGGAIGAFNGFFVAKFKLHPFIVTLASQLIVYTFLLLYVKAGNNNGMAISGLDKSYSSFITGSLLKIGGTPIPNYVWIAVICTIVMWFIWNKTTFGKNMFALGANEEAARVSGVNVFATTLMVFALAGAMYAVTGFIEGARVASNTANTGLNYESDAIAACVIGGVSFVGGIGKIRGIVIGVLMLRLIFVGLNMIGINCSTSSRAASSSLPAPWICASIWSRSEKPGDRFPLSPAVHRGGGGGISARTRADPGHWPPDPWGARTGCAPSLFIFNPGAMCYTDGEKDVRKHGPL